GSRAQAASSGWMTRIEVHTPTGHSDSSKGGRLFEVDAREEAIEAYGALFPDTGSRYMESIVGDFGYPDSTRIWALAQLTRPLVPRPKSWCGSRSRRRPTRSSSGHSPIPCWSTVTPWSERQWPTS